MAAGNPERACADSRMRGSAALKVPLPSDRRGSPLPVQRSDQANTWLIACPSALPPDLGAARLPLALMEPVALPPPAQVAGHRELPARHSSAVRWFGLLRRANTSHHRRSSSPQECRPDFGAIRAHQVHSQTMRLDPTHELVLARCRFSGQPATRASRSRPRLRRLRHPPEALPTIAPCRPARPWAS